jgi:hypothetical protein
MAIPVPDDLRELLQVSSYIHPSTPRAGLVVSVYSSGAIGHLVPQDVIGLVHCLREHAPAATVRQAPCPGR